MTDPRLPSRWFSHHGPLPRSGLSPTLRELLPPFERSSRRPWRLRKGVDRSLVQDASFCVWYSPYHGKRDGSTPGMANAIYGVRRPVDEEASGREHPGTCASARMLALVSLAD